ncbi:PAS domain S-box protein [Maribrevibacterium harenarium]|uniref:PAS domain S-box protein n=1 Tax=Maribrevibacterium harenarium TaxID=2589817 RepID=A0A501WGL7_9GAMM|nr:PAS domain-containing protein [Maribrevibacterium harenarium]TPE47500.1 PAS domain S-box protein [Maribrevibacterium harenarium]
MPNTTEQESFAVPCLTLSTDMIELIRDAVVVTDLDGYILNINQAYIDITGYQRNELIGERPAKIQSGRHDSVFYRVMWDSLLSNGFWQGEIWDRRKNGEIYRS